IPLDEVVNGVVVRSLPAHGREGIEDSRFGLFEIRQCKDPLRRSLLSGFRHDRRLLRPSPLLWSGCQSVERREDTVMDLTLPADFTKHVEQEIPTGHYRSRDELIEEAVPRFVDEPQRC